MLIKVRSARTRGGITASDRSFKIAATASQIYFRLEICDLTNLEDTRRYLSLRKRYYYFRFLKPNSGHVEIVLRVSFRPVLRHRQFGMSLCIGPTNFIRIWLSRAELPTSYRFSKWQPSAMLGVHHPRSVSLIVGFSLVLKFRLDRTYSSEIAMPRYFKLFSRNFLSASR